MWLLANLKTKYRYKFFPQSLGLDSHVFSNTMEFTTTSASSLRTLRCMSSGPTDLDSSLSLCFSLQRSPQTSNKITALGTLSCQVFQAGMPCLAVSNFTRMMDSWPPLSRTGQASIRQKRRRNICGYF